MKCRNNPSLLSQLTPKPLNFLLKSPALGLYFLTKASLQEHFVFFNLWSTVVVLTYFTFCLFIDIFILFVAQNVQKMLSDPALFGNGIRCVVTI